MNITDTVKAYLANRSVTAEAAENIWLLSGSSTQDFLSSEATTQRDIFAVSILARSIRQEVADCAEIVWRLRGNEYPLETMDRAQIKVAARLAQDMRTFHADMAEKIVMEGGSVADQSQKEHPALTDCIDRFGCRPLGYGAFPGAKIVAGRAPEAKTGEVLIEVISRNPGVKTCDVLVKLIKDAEVVQVIKVNGKVSDRYRLKCVDIDPAIDSYEVCAKSNVSVSVTLRGDIGK